MSYKFLIGAGGGFKVYKGTNNFASGGHDLYVRAGGALILADVEVCRENDQGIKCAQPQIVSGWFPGGHVGLGYRFYFTQNLGLRAEMRYRGVLEIVDGEAAPRGNFQINLGASFSF